ncbi:uncharacterized protein [Henckelia pumila]|uniref:uncharacterized protein n=1 Tax=Henckelia pumila TaxID=405737 RepID=UPI003C6DD635
MIRHLGIIDIFMCLKESVDRADLEVFIMRAWAIWLDRNRIAHDKERSNDIVSAYKGGILLEEHRKASAAMLNFRNDSVLGNNSRWTTPPPLWLRLDVDAVYNIDSNNFAIGGLFRDTEGKIVVAFGKKIKKPQSVVYAELIAIREGLLLAKDRRFGLLQVYSDSLLAVRAVTCPEDDRSYIGAIATDISSLLGCFQDARVFHVRRSLNMVAHSIAHFSFPSQNLTIWEYGTFPVWLVDLVIKQLHRD